MPNNPSFPIPATGLPAPFLLWSRALHLISLSTPRDFRNDLDWGKWCRSIATAALHQDAWAISIATAALHQDAGAITKLERDAGITL